MPQRVDSHKQLLNPVPVDEVTQNVDSLKQFLDPVVVDKVAGNTNLQNSF
jgi:hypothetical protein